MLQIRNQGGNSEQDAYFLVLCYNLFQSQFNAVGGTVLLVIETELLCYPQHRKLKSLSQEGLCPYWTSELCFDVCYLSTVNSSECKSPKLFC